MIGMHKIGRHCAVPGWLMFADTSCFCCPEGSLLDSNLYRSGTAQNIKEIHLNRAFLERYCKYPMQPNGWNLNSKNIILHFSMEIVIYDQRHDNQVFPPKSCIQWPQLKRTVAKWVEG